ncbi:MAG: hypothetical protein ACRDQA_10105 [Nocardioidaceae bacterium]
MAGAGRVGRGIMRAMMRAARRSQRRKARERRREEHDAVQPPANEKSSDS